MNKIMILGRILGKRTFLLSIYPALYHLSSSHHAHFIKFKIQGVLFVS